MTKLSPEAEKRLVRIRERRVRRPRKPTNPNIRLTQKGFLARVGQDRRAGRITGTKAKQLTQFAERFSSGSSFGYPGISDRRRKKPSTGPIAL